MIEPKPGDDPTADQVEDERVRVVEDVGLLHADGREIVDIEEPPIVDLVCGRPPVGEAIVLGLQQIVQPVEAGGLPAGAAPPGHGAIDVGADLRRGVGEPGEPPARHFLLTVALGNRLPLGRPARRQVLQRRQDTEKLLESRRFRSQLPFEPLGLVAQHGDRGAGFDRQDVRAVRDREPAVGECEVELPSLEHHAVLIAQDRQEHLAFELALDRRPVDVEVPRDTSSSVRSRARRATTRCVSYRRSCGSARDP